MLKPRESAVDMLMERGDPNRFLSLSQGAWKGAIGRRWPVLLRGAAQHWPALTTWNFQRLSELGGDRTVTLVHGNRERDATRFSSSSLSRYLAQLETGPLAGGDGGQDAAACGYLKEFDLFKELPELAPDAPVDGMFPPKQVFERHAWIGPKAAHTGLHYDLADNLAVLVRGAKRFYLAPPGTVEALGAMSRKYDRWARLADTSMRELSESRHGAQALLFQADLQPGDAIYVPRGWWHEVVNLQASIFVSGFFASRPRAMRLLATTGVRHFFHKLNRIGPRSCTCHPGCQTQG